MPWETATPKGQVASGIAAGRLSDDQCAKNFSDLHPPYAAHGAAVAADRSDFCHDAPCVGACPTNIDIPLFLRQIQTGQPSRAARTIFEQNIRGGMCARVSPTETPREEICVREVAEGRPVEIGRLQRHAIDRLMASGGHPFQRAAATGKSVAVAGAGPAGLACAHRLAMLGHGVVIFEAREKPGGLNEFGIAAYGSTHDFAGAEIDWLLRIGGITIETGRALGQGITLAGLQEVHDAVSLSIGLAGVNALRTDGVDKDGVRDALDFVAERRSDQAARGAQCGGDRRRHDRGGCGGAIPAAEGAKRHHSLSPGIGCHRGQPVRTGTGDFERRADPDQCATRCHSRQWRGARDRTGIYRQPGRRSETDRRDPASACRSGVQGDRPEAGKHA